MTTAADQALDEELALLEELAVADAQQDMLAFTTYTKPDFEVNWHHKVCCDAIDFLEAGRTPRELLAHYGISGEELDLQLAEPHPITKLYAGLTHPSAIDEPMTGLQIMLAPRHGKSEIVSRRMPAWWLGRNPDHALVCVSYSADLASRMNRDVQRIIDLPAYAQVFPDTQLNNSNVRTVTSSYLRNSDIFEIVNHRGIYRSAGIGGGITGMGANMAIVDDAFKNRKQADSAVERQTVWEWYASTLYTRLEKNARKLIINTRWHEDDLSGRLMRQAMADPDADQWFCLVFPAILDCPPGPGDIRAEGEALWPGKYSAARLAKIRATAGAYEWEALYQQRPAPPGGGVVQNSWWRYWKTMPDNLSRFCISADLTFKDSAKGDFCAYEVWGTNGTDYYLLDMRKDRMAFTRQLATMQALALQYPQATEKLVEDAANGAALIDTLKKSISGLIAIRPQGSKQARAEAVAPLIEAGNVYLPDPSIHPWVNDFVHEWSVFPNGAHDDMVDACSMALARLSKRKAWENLAMPWSATKESRWL